MTDARDLVASALRDITIRQASLVAQRTHQLVTEDDIARWMPAARLIHEANLTATADPQDGLIPVDGHEWACRMIALNLVARERGFDAGRIPGSPGADQPSRREMDLRPMREVIEVP